MRSMVCGHLIRYRAITDGLWYTKLLDPLLRRYEWHPVLYFAYGMKKHP